MSLIICFDKNEASEAERFLSPLFGDGLTLIVTGVRREPDPAIRQANWLRQAQGEPAGAVDDRPDWLP